MPKRALPITVLLGLMLFNSSCSPARAVQTTAGNASQTPSQSALPPGTIVNLDETGLDSLESYHLSFEQNFWEGEQQQTLQTIRVEYTIIRPWENQYTFQQNEAVRSPFAAFQFGEDFYVLRIGAENNRCFKLNTSQESFKTLPQFHIQGVFKSVEIEQVLETEVLKNNILSDHYRIGGIEIDGAVLESGEGDLWLERTSGSIVSFSGQAAGTFREFKQSVQSDWNYNLTDRGSVENISLPDECIQSPLTRGYINLEQEAAREDIPLPEDAENLKIDFDTLTFENSRAPQDMQNFFRFQFAAAGWDFVQQNENDTEIQMSFERNDRTTLIITIQPTDSSGCRVEMIEKAPQI